MFDFRVRRLVYPSATGAGPDYSTFILFQVEEERNLWGERTPIGLKGRDKDTE